MPFSVSIGDVIALCEVTVKLGEAIGAGRDAPKDYKRLKREVDRFQQLLDDMEPLRDREPSPATERLLKPLLREMEECKDALTAFIQKNPCPESILAKVLWVFRGPKRCALLREELSTYRQSLAMRLNSFYAQEQKSLLLLCSAGMLPRQDLIPRLETIIVVDPVGEHIMLPTFLSTSYELLVKVLKAYYEHQSSSIPGRSYVVRGDFDLVHGGDKQVVETTRWSEIFNPRLKVEMSIILRQHDAPKDICPRCQTPFQGDAVDGWALCSGCDGHFRVKVQIVDVNGHRPGLSEDGGEFEELSSPSMDASAPQNTKEITETITAATAISRTEWSQFRLLSIISIIRQQEKLLEAISGLGNNPGATTSNSKPSPTQPAIGDLLARVENWKSYPPSSLGLLQMSDILRVRRGPLSREFHMCLFEKALIFLLEAKKKHLKGPFSPQDADSSPRLSVKLKGRLFLYDIKDARDTSSGEEFSLTLDMKDGIMDSVDLFFRDKVALENWRDQLIRV